MSASDRVDVFFVGPANFRRSPQVGTAYQLHWRALAERLGRPLEGSAKELAGAWSPATYRANVRRNAHLLSLGALVIDIDVRGDVDRVADVLSGHRFICHETFSSTDENPRCRLVLFFDEPVDANTYRVVHAVVRAHLELRGLAADPCAAAPSQLAFLPVRRPGSGYRFAASDGAVLRADRIVRAQTGALITKPPPSGTWMRTKGGHSGAYASAALRSATEFVAAAAKGTRNDTLFRETFSVARIVDLDGSRIEGAMLDAAMVAGLPESEAKRTIASAIRARRGAT